MWGVVYLSRSIGVAEGPMGVCGEIFDRSKREACSRVGMLF